MITLLIQGPFKGSIKERVQVTLMTLCIDAMYIVPMVLSMPE